MHVETSNGERKSNPNFLKLYQQRGLGSISYEKKGRGWENPDF